jgi:hypothetical protein
MVLLFPSLPWPCTTYPTDRPPAEVEQLLDNIFKSKDA